MCVCKVHLQLEKDDIRQSELSYQALKYLSEHFRQSITVEGASKELGVSKNYLSRIFSQKLHMTFHQYLIVLRVDMARDLLRNTEKSIIAISLECGFGNTRTFNRVFKENNGMTPCQYRSQFQNA